MRASTGFKIGVLAVLGVGSGLISASILAHARNSADEPRVPGFTRTLISSDTLPEGAIPGGEFALGGPASVAKFRIGSMELSEENGTTRVEATAKILETRPDIFYMWSLVVMQDTYANVISNRNYTDQLFFVPLGEPIEVTFEETIQLPPGTYFVQVRLNEFASRDQVKDLGDEVLPRIQANLIHHEKIVIK